MNEIRNVKEKDIRNIETQWFKEYCPTCGARWESKDGWTTKCPAKGCDIPGNR